MRNTQLKVLVQKLEQEAQDTSNPSSHTMTVAADTIRYLDKLLAKLDEHRDHCIDEDEDDDKRHEWREVENSRGVHWECKNCGNVTREEP